MIEHIKRAQPLVIAADRVNEMHKLYSEGATLKDVGKRFGISKQRVSQLFIAHGLNRRPRNTPKNGGMPQQVYDFIVGYFEQNQTMPTYAEISLGIYGHENGKGNITGYMGKLVNQGLLVRRGRVFGIASKD